MYELSVSRTFDAKHYLTVPDPGPVEGSLHAHRYSAAATFRGPELSTHGYLVDIDDVVGAVDSVADGLRGTVLNELSAFEGRNPSVERLAEVFGDRLLDRFDPAAATALSVSIREDDVATVTHSRSL